VFGKDLVPFLLKGKINFPTTQDCIRWAGSLLISQPAALRFSRIKTLDQLCNYHKGDSQESHPIQMGC
jgi:hypothetical protein